MAATGLKIRAQALPVTHCVGGDTIRDQTQTYSLPEANTARHTENISLGEKKIKIEPLHILISTGYFF